MQLIFSIHLFLEINGDHTQRPQSLQGQLPVVLLMCVSISQNTDSWLRTYHLLVYRGLTRAKPPEIRC